MSRIAYVAGRYLPHRAAVVHIEDRGYQFADGVYEVILVRGGRLVDLAPHLARLRRSLGELSIAPPLGERALEIVLREVARRNGVETGLVYIQATRGVAPRDHAFPKRAKPVLVVTARRTRPQDPKLAEAGIAVVTVPDIRWQRCDIKSVSLLPNVLAKQRAREAGAFEAWQIDGAGYVTEGASTNAWIVTAAGEVITRQADNAILNGVTRLAVLDIIRREGYRFVERPFTLTEAKQAREAFATSTAIDLLPIVRIDAEPVADGVPGPLASRLRAGYLAHAAAG